LNDLTVTEFRNIRVLTTQQLADSYETDAKVISNNFNRNKDRYEEGKHYICLEGEEKREYLNHHQIEDGSKNATKIYLWTEKGAFLHAKSLNTDRAWEVYDILVDTYFEAKSVKPLTEKEMLRIQLGMIDDVEQRVEKLENNMVIDYGQQRVLTERVNQIVVHWLGGKESNAYSEMGKKVFKECSRDFNTYFNVNSRNNTPKLKFEDAVYYLAHWEPCNNTKLEIQNCNAQMKLGA